MFVVKEDGTAELRTVTLGTVSDGVAVVTSGLKEGETVVTNGQYRLQAGSKVQIRSETASAR